MRKNLRQVGVNLPSYTQLETGPIEGLPKDCRDSYGHEDAQWGGPGGVVGLLRHMSAGLRWKVNLTVAKRVQVTQG